MPERFKLILTWSYIFSTGQNVFPLSLFVMNMPEIFSLNSATNYMYQSINLPLIGIFMLWMKHFSQIVGCLAESTRITNKRLFTANVSRHMKITVMEEKKNSFLTLCNNYSPIIWKYNFPNKNVLLLLYKYNTKLVFSNILTKHLFVLQN